MKAELKPHQKDRKKRGAKSKINAVSANVEIEKSFIESINKCLKHLSDDDDEVDNIELDNGSGDSNIRLPIKVNGANMEDFEIQTAKAHHATSQPDQPITSDFAELGVVGRCVTSDLFRAVSRGQLNKVKLLLGRGAKVNVRDAQGHTVLMLALRIHDDIKRDDMFTFLLDAGVALDQIDKIYKRSILCWAAHLGLYKQVRQILLIAVGELNLNHKDIHGRTALHLAALQGHVKVVRLITKSLKKYGLTLDEEDSEGMTPLLTAARMGHSDIFEVLGAAGASTTRCDSIKRLSALQWSALGERERAEREIQRRHRANVTRKINGLLLPSVHSDSPRALHTGRGIVTCQSNHDEAKESSDLYVGTSGSSCSSSRQDIFRASHRSCAASSGGSALGSSCLNPSCCLNPSSCRNPSCSGSSSRGNNVCSKSATHPAMLSNGYVVDEKNWNKKKMRKNFEREADTLREINSRASSHDTYRSKLIRDTGSRTEDIAVNRDESYSSLGFGYRRIKLSRDHMLSRTSNYSSLGHGGSSLDRYMEENNYKGSSDSCCNGSGLRGSSDSSCSNGSGLRVSCDSSCSNGSDLRNKKVLIINSIESGQHKSFSGNLDKNSSHTTTSDDIEHSSEQLVESTSKSHIKNLSHPQTTTDSTPQIFPLLANGNTEVSAGRKTDRSVKFSEKTVEWSVNFPSKAAGKKSSDRINKSRRQKKKKRSVGSVLQMEADGVEPRNNLDEEGKRKHEVMTSDSCGERKHEVMTSDKRKHEVMTSDNRKHGVMTSDSCGVNCGSWRFITESCPVCSAGNWMDKGKGNEETYNYEAQNEQAKHLPGAYLSSNSSYDSKLNSLPSAADSNINVELGEPRVTESRLNEFKRKSQKNDSKDLFQKDSPNSIRYNPPVTSSTVNERHSDRVFPTIAVSRKSEEEESESNAVTENSSDVISDVSYMTNLLRIKSEQLTSSFLPPVSQRLMSARSCSTNVTLEGFEDEDELMERTESVASKDPEPDIC